MKTNILKTIFFIVLSLTLTNCVKDDSYETPRLDQCAETTLSKNLEVSNIPANAIVSQYTQNDVIEAFVTSSDISGNFFKSISFQTLDKTKAFSVPVDMSSTFINFEPGRKVFIKLKGLYTDVKFGGLRIGSLYGNSSGGAEVGRLTIEQVQNSLVKSCTIVNENLLSQTLTIEQAMNDNNLNKLIDIDNVQFSDQDLNKPYYDANNDIGGATNHHIIDVKGNEVIIRFSSYSNFASKIVPSGMGRIRGVMTKYGTDYQFVVRTEKDIKLGGSRNIVNLFNESFSSNFTNWTKISVIGNEIWTIDSVYGNPGACAKMNGFASGPKANEDWLISPSINTSGLAKVFLNFETATNYDGTPLTLFVSDDYIGSGLPSLATWTPVTTTFAPNNPPFGMGFVWTKSTPCDLSAFGNKPKIYIAYKYISTTSKASTWEVDNVKITAGN